MAWKVFRRTSLAMIAIRQFKVVDGTLRIRSRRTASRYLGSAPQTLMDEDGFIDSGDVVAERDGRYYFVGRRGGIINVGGLKVHPEEVEQIINRHASREDVSRRRAAQSDHRRDRRGRHRLAQTGRARPRQRRAETGYSRVLPRGIAGAQSPGRRQIRRVA